jgi:hypothetical protein
MLDILVEYTKRPTGVLTLEPATQTVEWETANINTARVYVTGADGIRTLFAESPSGSEPASFMILGHPLHFELVGVEHNPYPEGPLLAMADYDGAGGTVSEVLPLCQRPGRNVLFVHGFPPGININSDGTITGTPWEFGEFIFYIIVTDALGQQVAGPYIMGITGP